MTSRKGKVVKVDFQNKEINEPVSQFAFNESENSYLLNYLGEKSKFKYSVLKPIEAFDISAIQLFGDCLAMLFILKPLKVNETATVYDKFKNVVYDIKKIDDEIYDIQNIQFSKIGYIMDDIRCVDKKHWKSPTIKELEILENRDS